MKTRIFALLLAATMAGPQLSQGAEKFEIDPNHTYVGFAAKHMMLSTVKGRFKAVKGTILLDEKDIKNSSVEVEIQSASLDTETEQRDNHLRSADFFDVEKFPVITFKSSKILHKDGAYLAVGSLTIRGVTKEVQLPFRLIGPIGAGENRRLAVESELTLNRQDYGVSWNSATDNGGVVVSDEIKLDLQVEAIAEGKSGN